MRKLVVFLFALFLALQGAMAMARAAGPCCDGCHDMAAAACASASCAACVGQAPDVQRMGLPRADASEPHFPAPLAGTGRISFEIWKPPR